MPGGEAASSSTVHAWDRFERMWVALFHVGLAVPTVLVVARFGSDGPRIAAVVATVAAVAGARHFGARRLVGVEEESRRHLAIGLAWAAVTLPAMVVLVDAEGAFFFAVYGLFPMAFLMLPRSWAIGFAAVLVPCVLIGAQGVSALEDSGFVVSVVGSALLAPALGAFINAISRQSYQRHEAIVALEAAQDEAEALLQAGLAISRSRNAADVVAAVGTCLAARGVDTVTLRTGDELLATWHDPAAGARTPDRCDTAVTVGPAAPGPGTVLEVSGSTALTSASRRTLETLACSCELALANFALVDQARQRGVLEERARLAREIHDTLAQGFVSILTQLQAAGGSLEAAPPEVADRVARAGRIARASLGEARRSVQALRPDALEAATLPDAIRRVVARWSEDAAVPATVTVTGLPDQLPAAVDVTLLRATQEALANVARHAAATSVTVTLSFLGDAVVLDVHDDGRGFDPAAPRNGSGGGFGLEALRQRVDDCGGVLGVETEPGGGTTVTVHVPVAIGQPS